MEQTITNVVRRAIRESGRSLRDLERATGIEAAQLSRFMNRKGGMSLEAFDRLAGALGLTATRIDNAVGPKGT
jgi:transcriptional regulator with XRE-family HTH domain